MSSNQKCVQNGVLGGVLYSSTTVVNRRGDLMVAAVWGSCAKSVEEEPLGNNGLRYTIISIRIGSMLVATGGGVFCGTHGANEERSMSAVNVVSCIIKEER